MAKKRPTPTKSRLKRFGKWSDSHRADILEEVGLTEQQFRALSRGDRRNTLDRGISLDKQSKDPAMTAAPQSVEQLRAQAGNAGQLRYGTAQAEMGRYGGSIDPWFQDYVQRTQQIQGQQQQMAAPVIQQAQQQAQQAGQTVLDPNSAQSENDILAAASRKAMGEMFANLLSGQQTANNTYYANQAGAVEAARVGEHQTQRQGMSDLLKERGAYESDYLTDAKQREHTNSLERKAFGLKVADAQGIDPVTGKKKPDPKAGEVNQYGVKNGKWADMSREERLAWIRKYKRTTDAPKAPHEPVYGVDYKDWLKMSPADRAAAKKAFEGNGGGKKDGLTPAEQRARSKEKAKQKQRADFIRDALANRPPYPKGHPQEGQTPTRKEIISQLIKKGYSRDEIRKASPYVRPRQPTAPDRDHQPG